MVHYFFFLSFLLGILINSTFSSLPKTAFEIKEPFIPFDQQYFIPSVENIVDSRFKLLAANFQDQINDLKGKVNTLDVSKTANKGLFESQHQHEIQKREANWRPFCEYSGSFCTFYYPDHPDAGQKKGKYKPTVTNGMQQDPPQVKGVPSSCKDLQLLGHKLNGLYLIKTSQPNEGTKIRTVFCDFQSPTLVNVSQSLIGNIDIKTKSVHFYVQRNMSFNKISGSVPFNLARLNEGGAFNLTSGVFTSPVAGIYHFYFAATKRSPFQKLNVFLQVNSIDVGCAFTAQGITANSTMLAASLSSSLRLKKNDKVSLSIKEGAIIDNESHITHFTGWLVEEDLI